MIKLEEVAKRAGVSLATASYALNNNKKIKEETRKKVLQVAEELGYIPNALARGLMSKKTGTIGLVVSSINIPYTSALVQEIEADIRARGYNLLLGISANDFEVEKKIIEDFRSRRVDGIIIAPGHMDVTGGIEEKTNYISNLNKAQVPFVFINTCYPHIKANYVIVDLDEGSYNLTAYLLNKGYRDILFFAGKRVHFVTKMRCEGYQRAYRDNNLAVPKERVIECGDYDFDSAYRAVEEWLRRNELPDVFMASNDAMALGILKALREKGVSVPGDVALVGYDDIVYPTLAEISLTTVRIPIGDMCSRTVDMLISNIEGSDNSLQQIMLKPSLVIRESS